MGESLELTCSACGGICDLSENLTQTVDFSSREMRPQPVGSVQYQVVPGPLRLTHRTQVKD